MPTPKLPAHYASMSHAEKKKALLEVIEYLNEDTDWSSRKGPWIHLSGGKEPTAMMKTPRGRPQTWLQQAERALSDLSPDEVKHLSPGGRRVLQETKRVALRFGKAGLKAVPLLGLAAEFADIPEAKAGTISEEFRTREEVLEAEKAAEESAAFLAEQPGYEPEGTPPAWADPEWEKQRRFGEEPEEEADYSPEGTRKSRDAAAKKAMEK